MNQNASKTIYLGRARPLLHSTVDYLIDRWPVSQVDGQMVWNLSNLLIVVPTARGGRRLSTLLAQKAVLHKCTLARPEIITIGELPQQLFQPALPLASEIEQTLAWTQALADTPDEELSALLSNLPQREPLTPWIELASTIRGLHEDLAAGELDFSDVEREVSGETEQRRWRLLSSLYAKYIKRLQSADRSDPFLARSQAIAENRCHSTNDIILVGTSDLSRSVTSLLRATKGGRTGLMAVEPEALAETIDRSSRAFRRGSASASGSGRKVPNTFCSITALVAADAVDRDHFDGFGSIIASQWTRHELPFQDLQLVAAQDVADQASTVADIIEAWADKFSPQQITVGITHDSLVGPVEFELRTRGVASHREIGWTISQTPVGRLLELLAEHLSRGTWRSLAALVRHADVYDFIERNFHNDLLDRAANDGQWLLALDNLIANHYPTRCDVELPSQAATEYEPAARIRDMIQHSVRDLRGPFRTLSDWTGRVVAWLSAIYHADNATLVIDPLSRSGQAVTVSIGFMESIQQLEKTLDVKVSAASAIEMLISRLVQLRVFDPSGNNQTTISGWLDLALDDSPAMVVASLNHPYVPESITADPFLPGGLRTRLQLNDNERRLARDIHSLDVMLSCRPAIKLIIGARSLDGSPTPPSRLLAAVPPLDAARRLVDLLEPIKAVPTSALKGTTAWTGVCEKSNLPIPTLPTDKTVDGMSVTAFKDYLDCPYRFFLRHVLHLRPLDDASGELQANQFGDLIHNTLQWYGESDLKDSADESMIESAMQETLDKYAARFFGTSPNAAVRLQIEQARRRLSAVAKAQSKRRTEGWHIDKVEAPFGKTENARIAVDGMPMPIRGRIDRIDHHDDGRWAIIDYKTHGHPPRKKHLKEVHGVQQWIDLQLPLYRLLIPFVIGKDVDVEQVALSYFNIGDNISQTRINDADFTASEFAAAYAVIETSIRRIRAGDFKASDDVMYDDYSMILQTGAVATLFERLMAADVENDVAE